MKTEFKIQQEIFVWHWNNYVDERGLLFMNHNNAKNAIEGARLKSMGLTRGVSDMTYLKPGGKPLFIEIKTGTGKQSKAQQDWQSTIEAAGYTYLIIRSLDEFKACAVA